MRSRVTPNTWPTSSSVRLRPSSSPKRSSRTLRSRSLIVPSTSPTCSRSSVKVEASTGDRALLSSMKSPRWESPSSPMGVSRETGSCVSLRISRTRSGVISIPTAISWVVGSRPYSCTSRRLTRISLLIVSTMWTGIRMVRPWSAIERVMAWRIHHVAYVENLKPLR